MERKYFKCYFCKTGNSYFVPITQKGKECRCCLAYNYFFTHNNNYHKNNNRRKRRNPHRNSFFPATNTTFNQSNSFNNRRSNNRLDIDTNLINQLLNPITIFSNDLRYNEVKEDEKNIIKYSWLKKEELTKEIMEKNKDGYTCSICLENLKIKDDINILKCGHIFHYKCIENLLDHQIKICPNCRCDIKTGEKQPNIQNNDNLFDFPLYSMGNEIFIGYDPFDDYDDYIPVFD